MCRRLILMRRFTTNNRSEAPEATSMFPSGAPFAADAVVHSHARASLTPSASPSSCLRRVLVRTMSGGSRHAASLLPPWVGVDTVRRVTFAPPLSSGVDEVRACHSEGADVLRAMASGEASDSPEGDVANPQSAVNAILAHIAGVADKMSAVDAQLAELRSVLRR